MAMELFVFSDRPLEPINEWNAEIAAIGFDLILEEGSVAGLRGSWPTKLRGRDVWVEYDHFDPEEFFAEQDYVTKERSWKYLLAFRWGSDLYACPAALMAAAAYAKATDGVVLDEYEPIFRSWEEAAQMAKHADADIPRIEAWLKEQAGKR